MSHTIHPNPVATLTRRLAALHSAVSELAALAPVLAELPEEQLQQVLAALPDSESAVACLAEVVASLGPDW
jgi:hypothetical protein